MASNVSKRKGRTGATNYNTFAHPHSVHVPFGKKLVGGNTRWYGECRLLTAEDWGAGSGGLEGGRSPR
ncbi:MAG TPA: hypothetical protein VGA37_02745 [Gemmatimonadales bacterium]